MGKSWFIMCMGISFFIFLIDTPQAFSQETESEEFTLEEITVTAQKRDENQQKVAIAMDVISGDQLAEAGKINLDDILSSLSNVMINYSQDGMRVSVRGLTETDGLFNDVHTSTPSVAVNIDGAYNPSAGSGMNLFDIERVEVLYGPQSTMYASNSPGGIVNVVTAAPKTDKYSASASLEYGSYNLFTGQAMFNAPIVTDKLATRLAVQMQKRDPYVSGEDQIGVDTKSARLKTLYQPNDDLSATVTFNYTKKKNAGMLGGSVQYFDDQDGYWYTGGGFPPTYSSSGIKVTDPWTAPFLSSEGGAPGGSLGPNEADQDTKGVTGEISWNSGIGSLSIVPQYSSTTSDDQGQISTTDTEGNTITYMAYTAMRERQRGVEARMTSAEDFLFEWILGVNYFKSRSVRYTTYSLESESPNLIYVSEEAKAVFGNITYPFTDRFRGTGGMRWSMDKMRTSQTIGLTKPPTYRKPNYKVGIEYDLAENSMLFANYATSYRVNAFRMSLPPEEDKTYTIGVKNRFFDNKLQLNGSAYYYDYKNVQIVVTGTSTSSGIYEDEIVDSDGNPVDLNGDGEITHDIYYTYYASTGGPPGEIADPWDQLQTGAYRTIGADISADWIITSKDRLNLAVTFLNSEWSDCKIDLCWKSADGGYFWPSDGQDFNGMTYSYSPKWTVNLGYQHNFILGTLGTLVPHVDIMYKSHYLLDANPLGLPVSYQESYYTVNANATYTHAGGKWTLNGYVKNATNYAAKTMIAGGGGGGMTISDPRTYGAVLSVRF